MANSRHEWLVRWITAVVICGQVGLPALGQGVSNRWMGGYLSEAGLPWGGCDLEFGSGQASISYLYRDIDFKRTNTNISDGTGMLLFSTNGAYLANITGDTLLDGSGLNPSDYTSNYPEGLHLSQTVLALPDPGSPSMYMLIHGTIDDQVAQCAYHIYLTRIDMSLDGGFGAVVAKNQIVLTDTFNIGKLGAVRHANGRDWWVFAHKLNTDFFFRFLVTPTGIVLSGTQAIGIVRPPDNGQVCFTPDGTKFAYYWGEDDLDIFSFDRCSGEFYDPVHVVIDDTDGVGGLAFSSNSQYLYVSSTLDMYQVDVTAPDIQASLTHIAAWDGFYSPQPPFATIFDNAQLAPDGKVYIGTGNSTFHMHVINNPDAPGLDCGMVQHGIELPTYYQNSLPNHPNYHLGPVDGSVCDSLGINAGWQEGRPPPLVQVYPNPGTGACTLSYPAQPDAGTLEVRDQRGRLVLRERLPQWSTLHDVVLLNASAGLYDCRLRWPSVSASTRILIVP